MLIFVDVELKRYSSGHQELLLNFPASRFYLRIDLGYEDNYKVQDLVEKIKKELDLKIIHDKVVEVYNVGYNIIKLDPFKEAFINYLLTPNPTWHFYTHTGDPFWSYPLDYITLTWEN